MEVEVPVGALFTKKRKRTALYPGRKKRRVMRGVVRKPIAPPRTGGFYGLNQGNHGRELKTIDTTTACEFSTTGTIALINGVAQGTDFTTRVGRKFNMRSILLRARIGVGGTATASVWRMMLVYDKQANAAAPAITDILDSINTTSNNNLANRERFIVIMDKLGYVEAAGRSQIPFKKYKRCALEVTNGGTGNTVGSIVTGSLWLVTTGQLVTGATAPVATVQTRIRFTDE